MFTLREHARRKIGLAAIGAAASMGFGQATHAATVDWDPDQNPPASGGTIVGTFDNSTPNWVKGGVNSTAATTDDAHFGVVGNTVNVPAGTVGDYNALSGGVQVGTLSLDVGGYTISGGPVVVGPFAGSGVDGSAATLAIANTAGNNTITSHLYLANGGNVDHYSAVDVAGGTTLTVGDINSGFYAKMAKTGDGTLIINGQYVNSRGGDPGTLAIRGGTVLMNGVTSTLNGAQGTGQIHLLSGARLGGTGTVRFSGGTNDVEIPSGAFLSPATTGTTGTFSLTGGQYSRGFDTNFRTGSHFELDLVSPDAGVNDFSGNHDVLHLTAGDYGTLYTGPSNFNAENGALVDINGGAGPLTPGTYHIIRFFEAVAPLQGGDLQHTVNLINNGFVTGNVPAGYTYQFLTVPSSGQNNDGFDGIDLVVTASGVPEPASIGVLGLGTGLMLVRGRRKSRA